MIYTYSWIAWNKNTPPPPKNEEKKSLGWWRMAEINFFQNLQNLFFELFYYSWK